MDKVQEIGICEICGYPFIVGDSIYELETLGQIVVCCEGCRKVIYEGGL